jgi:(p)ppGpp synthase/HD superfamily hydrolase
VKRARGNRKEILSKIEAAIKQRLEHDGISARVLSREKHLLSLYQKMRGKRLSFHDVFDVYAFRVVVENVDICYRVLGVVHSLYKPVPGRFKDYIAIPKANGYQSLHTVLFGPYGVPIEVQIRTEEMERVAESGIAAHWLYKSGDDGAGSAHARAREWLRALLEMQKNAGNSLEFLENVKIDLFPDEVYVFTPRGEIMELPRGATAVDFAYAVHTDVGNTCIAAKIDRRLAPLRTAAQRPDGGDHHRARRAPQSELAEFRRDRQGALQYPPLSEEPAPRRGGEPRPPPARQGAAQSQPALRGTECRARAGDRHDLWIEDRRRSAGRHRSGQSHADPHRAAVAG